MKTTDFSYYIERYIAGEMSESEQNWFTKELEGNEKLRKEVELRKKTEHILKHQDIISLRRKLMKIEAQRNAEKAKTRHISRSQVIRYAAVVTVFLVIGTLFLMPGPKLSNEEMVRKYYKAYESPTNRRSAQSTTDNDFSLAMEYYNTHDYNRAAELFTKVLESRPNDMQTVLLNGVANFEEKRYPEAKQSFGKVIENKHNLFIDQAKWYLALCYLNNNEDDKAKQMFTAISSENGIFQKDAKKILKGLK